MTTKNETNNGRPEADAKLIKFTPQNPVDSEAEELRKQAKALMEHALELERYVAARQASAVKEEK